ncbi:hypothetical protein Tco_1016224 [Tanacetum coccineum]|uniref:Uncharacterized protein n=1 Tax=Tanacetum coccineum TaxID=301880 RepID=A0ABQ5FP22_9ASTR
MKVREEGIMPGTKMDSNIREQSQQRFIDTLRLGNTMKWVEGEKGCTQMYGIKGSEVTARRATGPGSDRQLYSRRAPGGIVDGELQHAGGERQVWSRVSGYTQRGHRVAEGIYGRDTFSDVPSDDRPPADSMTSLGQSTDNEQCRVEISQRGHTNLKHKFTLMHRGDIASEYFTQRTTLGDSSVYTQSR